jgi:hypothetical protein
MVDRRNYYCVGNGYAKAKGIPLVHSPAGERKHELAEEYLALTNITQGLFLILVGRAQAHSMVESDSTGKDYGTGKSKGCETINRTRRRRP